ncbi:MAG: DUF4405 domain-containing protein [Bacteroidales bacterium]|nr:DUF4405 domain-containing protein [Bacteroidales bacterium]
MAKKNKTTTIFSWCKDKAQVNLVIDAIMMLVLMAVAGMGILIKFVLVPGFKRNEIYGQDMELYFWGYTRHQWGTVHLILSFILLSLLILHIALHWKMIVCIFRKLIPRKTVRQATIISIGLLSLVLFLSPLLVRPEVVMAVVRNNHRNMKVFLVETGVFNVQEKVQEPENSLVKPLDGKKNSEINESEIEHDINREIIVYGSMTLDEVAKKYKISPTKLAQTLDIAKNKTTYRLGRLKKEYDFTMGDVRKAVRELMD